ncbi:hypothetical protein M433DRAFT_180284 [Acidomyces richmondensis BFW]|nr:MAG: hypothetical protein FE78DRAFT_297139 [Acidomyces sp. 'richmondensis']KYG50689.1 hypothetical protein M433DRAFT_180284 [Acidomyces richmondensis BFW]
MTGSMAFQKTSGVHVKGNLQKIVDGRRASTTEATDAEMDLKHRPLRTSDPEAETEDAEWSDKKEPPRFSTLFENTPPLSDRILDSQPWQRRKSGVLMPTPIFILLVIILLFESTLLFAYTVIGLYNNLPQRLVPSMKTTCDCTAFEKQPAVNIAPNFMMPQAQAQVTVTQTVTSLRAGSIPGSLPASTSSIISSITLSSPSSTSTIEASSQVATIASEVLSLLSAHTSSTTSSLSSTSATPNAGVTTSTEILSELPASPSTVNSIKLVTIDASGSTLPPRSTVTSIKVINPSQAAAESSVQAALASISEALSVKPIHSSTPSMTSARISSAKETPAAVSTSSIEGRSATASSGAASTSGFCIGGSGAVELDCVPKP